MERRITKEFLEMKKVTELPWQFILDCLSLEKLRQEEILELTVNHPVAKLYSPSTEYIRSFIKMLINKVEDSNMEVSEQIYSLYLECLNSIPKMEYYRSYTMRDGLQITLQETRSLVVNGTTGLTTWQASHVLAQFCIEDEHDQFKLKSSNILELGSGLGLTGLLIIKAISPPSYTFSDHHQAVLDVLAHNIAINLTSQGDMKTEFMDGYNIHWNNSEVNVKNIDWENPKDLCEYDVVLGADILFDLQLISPLLNVITKSLKSVDSVAIVAATVRNEATISYFLKELVKLSLIVEKCIERRYQKSSSLPEETVKIFCIMKSLLPT